MWYEAGSQKNNGNSPALMPNAVRNSIDRAASSPGVRRSGQARARSAKFSVPAWPYSSPMAVRRNADASRFSPTYVKAAWSCARVRCRDISTNEPISITSNQT